MQLVRAGGAILWDGGTLQAGHHLWFILSDPDPETNHVIVVMVVTERVYTDKTVTLIAGTHPFIRHTSNVAYGTARRVPASKLAAALKSGSAKLQPDMSVELLGIVRGGLLESSRTNHGVVEYCRGKFGR